MNETIEGQTKVGEGFSAIAGDLIIDKEMLEGMPQMIETTFDRKMDPLTANEPKRRRAARRMPELWAVVEMPDGSRQAYTCVSKALQVAGEEMVREVQLCRISPKSRGFKVVEVVKV